MNDNQPVDDLWAAAMQEQTLTDGEAEQVAPGTQFADELHLIHDIPVKMTVELGRTKMTIKQLLRLGQGSVVTLDGLAGEPLDIMINGYLVAQGEVVVVSDNFGIRITEIITPSERISRLS